jgi:hypothetical protein
LCFVFGGLKFRGVVLYLNPCRTAVDLRYVLKFLPAANLTSIWLLTGECLVR